MWSQYYQPNVSQLLRKSIISLCSENVPYDDKLEVDGIICISKGTEGDHIVVKLHEVLDNIGKESWKCIPDEQYEPPDETVVKSEPDEEEIFTIVKDDSAMYCKLSPVPNTGRADSRSRANSEYVDDSNGITPTRNTSAGEDLSDDVSYENRAHVLPSLDIFSNSSYQQSCDDDHNSGQGNSDHTSGDQSSPDFLCRVCSGCFSTFSSLSTHAYEVHGRFTCKQCLNTFSMLCNLKRHERLHAGRKPYTCATCGKGFSRNSDLRLHETKRHKDVPMEADKINTGNLNDSLPLKNCKSSNLVDVLSKLSQRRMLDVRKNEGRSRRKHRAAFRPREHSVIDLSSDIENSIESDTEEQPKEGKNDEDGGDMEVNLESDTHLGDKDYTDSTVPLPLPLFTRSILKTPGENEAIPNMDQPKIIHIVPNNNTSGGHMEEAAEVKSTYRSSYIPAGGISDSSNLNTIHGLSFGRIVFPGQNEVPQDVHRVKELPFRTYLGSHKEDSKRTPSREDRAHSSSPSTYQALSPVLGSNTNSRSNSPVALTKDDQAEVPAFISLDREYWCRTCKTQWSSFRNYEQHHVQQHLRYPCQFCDQTFSNKNNRSRHIRSHTGQREHTCQECGKSFSRSDTLREHQIIHTDGYLGDKCNYCNLVIKKKAELLGHIKKCSQRQKQKYSDTTETASPSANSE